MPVVIMDGLDGGPGMAAAPPHQTILVQPIIDLQYFKTPPGLAKIAQIIFGIVTMATGPPIWLVIVSWLALFGTCAWFWIYFFSINKKYSVNPPWIVLEFYFTTVAFGSYGVMSLCSLFFILPAIFGLMVTIAYGVGAFFLFTEWKEWRQSPGTVPK